jgi:hypothetical protein
VITSASSASGTAGNAFSYQILATNLPTNYTAIGLPAGLSVNASTGLISGTPTAAGSSTITLSATNAGGTGTAILKLIVQPGTTTTSSPKIGYVQGHYATPQTAQTTVSVTFTAAQAAGDLNVVVVGWNDSTAVVNTVTDNSGNTYQLAVGPTAVSRTLSQSIYYASNIAAASPKANTVTVKFSSAAVYPDIRIVEYSGVSSANPVDVTAASSGSGTTSQTNSVATSNATDLIVGANTVTTVTARAGSGFTSRIVTSPDGDIVEDRIVTAAGSYQATAPISPAGSWIMQMVAFRASSVQ